MGFSTVRWKNSLFKIVDDGVYLAGSEVDSHDLALLRFNAKPGEVFFINGSFHLRVHC